MMERPLLELRGVCKSFGSEDRRLEVLSDVTLALPQGEFAAIVGYSGSGKSTLISLLAGLLRPDSGTILMNGRPVEGPGPDRAVIFQNYSLLPWMTVFDNVYLAVDQVFQDWPRARKREQAERHIAMVKLAEARHKKPHELSGGMKQRVAVARALAMDPQILLMDEPLGALDALTRATLQDEIVRLWEKDRKTVLLITNDVDEGILLADRIIPMSAGPRATLGPSIHVGIDRPRDRKALNHDARFKAVRKEVIDYLLGPGRKRPAAGAPERLRMPEAGVPA
jgi:nitrate/nitrite transport system ATP-binding protein